MTKQEKIKELAALDKEREIKKKERSGYSLTKNIMIIIAAVILLSIFIFTAKMVKPKEYVHYITNYDEFFSSIASEQIQEILKEDDGDYIIKYIDQDGNVEWTALDMESEDDFTWVIIEKNVAAPVIDTKTRRIIVPYNYIEKQKKTP